VISPNVKIYVAGHNGLVGSAIVRELKKSILDTYLSYKKESKAE
jgi:nucleoside-diphosphate-sugar epimerase